MEAVVGGVGAISILLATSLAGLALAVDASWVVALADALCSFDRLWFWVPPINQPEKLTVVSADNINERFNMGGNPFHSKVLNHHYVMQKSIYLCYC